MPKGFFTVDEVLRQVLAYSDSDGNYLPSDDDRSPSEGSESDGASVHMRDGSPHEAAHHIDHTQTLPYRDRGDTNQPRRGRFGGSRGGQSRAVNRDDSWVYLGNEEVYHKWIRDFDEPVGYRGDKDLTNAKPIDFLSLFLDDDFWSIVTNETNRYANQFLDREQIKQKSRFHDWCDVTVPEMKAFMSLHLCMGHPICRLGTS